MPASTTGGGSGGAYAEIGASGLNFSLGGLVTEELNPTLQGRKAIQTYRLMKDNDSVVGAILFAIEMLLRRVEWHVELGDAEEDAQEFLEGCMEDMSHSWSDLIAECLSMLPYGWAFHEIVYKKRNGYQPSGSSTPSSRFSDGKIGWRKLPLRAQETLNHWMFDDDGGMQAFVQKPPPLFQDIEIPMEKGLLFRTTSYKNNPEGRSLLRSAYTSWFYKKRIQQIEGTGIERDLAGFPVFWLPAEFLAADATPAMTQVVQAFTQIGQNIRRDKQEHIIMPLAYDMNGNKAFDFTLMNSGGSRSFDTSAIIQRYNNEIAMTVLADFILLGHEAVGSFALSSDKTDIFAIALGALLDSIEDVINRFAVPRLFELNGMDMENLPAIKHGDIETPDLTELGAYITALAGTGMTLFPDDDLESYLREAAHLPEKSEEAKEQQEEALQNGTEVQPTGGPTAAGDSFAGGGTPINGSGTGTPEQRFQDAISTARASRQSSGFDNAGSQP